MEHQRAIRVIYGLFLVPAIAGVALYLVAHLIGVRAAVVAGSTVLLCWGCALVAVIFAGNVFSGFPRWAIALFGLFTLWVLWLSSMPPYYRDDLIVHLAFPKHILLKGAWETLPFQPATYSPNLLTPLNMVLLNAGLDRWVSFIPALFQLATALLLAHWVAHEHGRGWGMWAAGSLLTLPLLFRLSTTAYTDPVAMFYSCGGAYYFFQWMETGDAGDGAKGGVALAAGSAVKYNAGLLLAGFLIAAFFLKKGERNQWLKTAGVCVFAVLLVCGPWWAFEGRPPDPFKLFAGPVQERMTMCGESAPMALASPIRAFFQGEEGNRCRYDGTLNPLLLVLGFAVFATSRPPRYRLLGLSVALFMTAAVLLASIMVRYFLPVVPVLLFLSAGFIAPLAARGKRPVAIALAVAALTLNLWGYARAAQTFEGWDHLAGRETKERFLARSVPSFGPSGYMNAHLQKNDTVYFVFMGNQVYYSDVPYTYDPFWDGATLMGLLTPSADAGSLAQGLKNKGITHLLYRKDMMQRFIAQNRFETVFAQFLSRNASVEYEDAATAMVALK